MPVVTPLEIARLRQEMSPGMKIWVRQQATERMRLRGLGALQDKRLREATGQKFAMVTPPGSPTFPVLAAFVQALVLEEEIRRREDQFDDAQLANVDLQNILQKQQETLQMMSNISRMLFDTAQSVIRKMGG